MQKANGQKPSPRGKKQGSPVGRTGGVTGGAAGGVASGAALPISPKDNGNQKPTTPTRMPDASDNSIPGFSIGENVWVNGSKPGVLAYLGETNFAQGPWAGVVLNDPVGKNDGSVNGIRYFMCEPEHGILIRPWKLTRHFVDESDSQSNESHQTQDLPPKGTSSLSTGLSMTSVKTGHESGSDAGSIRKNYHDLRLGDRVMVAKRRGVLRYKGLTRFSKGEWCGVELDEPVGKNDGAVYGIRYFQCQPNFGLFAPVEKVNRICFPSTSPSKLSSSKRVAMGVSSLVRTPSSSSISSVSSKASSMSGHPSRSGLLTETSSLYARKISGTTALQEALKEKQQHIEQLLAERDLERAEVAKATSRIIQVEQELNDLKAQHLQNESDLDHLRTQLGETQKEKTELALQLEEEKRKVEDLQFRVEEESITKGDLETQTKLEHAQIRQLEENLLVEQSKAAELETELENSRGRRRLDAVSLRWGKKSKEAMKTMAEHEQELLHLKAKHETEITALTTQSTELTTQLKEVTHELEMKTQSVKETEDLCKTEKEAAEARHTAELHKVSGELQMVENKFEELEKQYQALKKSNAENTKELEDTTEKLSKRDCEIIRLTSTVDTLNTQITAFKDKVSEGEKQIAALLSENEELSHELKSLTEKPENDAGQLPVKSPEFLKKERSLSDLQDLLLNSSGLEKGLCTELNRADWRLKQQSLKDSINQLQVELEELNAERTTPENRTQSKTDLELERLRSRLYSTETVLKNALDYTQGVDQLVEALNSMPDNTTVQGSANGSQP